MVWNRWPTPPALSSHAFYLHVNGTGGSYLVSPHKYDNLLDTSLESRRDNAAFPMIGEPVECLLHANLRIHDAFGYWPAPFLSAVRGIRPRLYRFVPSAGRIEGNPSRSMSRASPCIYGDHLRLSSRVRLDHPAESAAWT